MCVCDCVEEVSQRTLDQQKHGRFSCPCTVAAAMAIRIVPVRCGLCAKFSQHLAGSRLERDDVRCMFK